MLENIGIEDTQMVKEWKENFFNGKEDNAWKLWTIIAYKYWAESYGIK